mgnify:CR=1 FL=1
MIVEKLVRRTVFKPEKHGSNALFTFFAQHFTHQFFKTDFKRGPAFTWGGHGVSLNSYKGNYCNPHFSPCVFMTTVDSLKYQVPTVSPTNLETMATRIYNVM